MNSTLTKRITRSSSKQDAALAAIRAVKQQIAERVAKSHSYRAEEISGAVAMNKAWHETVQTPLREWVHENVFNFRSKRLINTMSGNVLAGPLWEGPLQTAWDSCEENVYTLLARTYDKAYKQMAQHAGVEGAALDESLLRRTVGCLHEHSEYYYRNYLLRIAGPQIAAITEWMEAHPELIDSPAGVQKIAQLNKAIRARNYHNTLSSVHTGRVYNFAALDWMQDSGVATYIIQEVLDERTCDVCIMLHGREYPVRGAAMRRDAFLDAPHPLDAREEIPFPTAKQLVSMHEAQVEELDGPQPPFHPGCRGRLLPK